MSKKKRKTPPTKQQQTVVNQLIIKAPTRRINDVGAWRNALKSADGGRLNTLFDLYEDLYIDGVLSDSVDKRISAVTNSEITFQNAKGEEVDEIADLIDTLDFEEVLTQIMHVRFWGRSAIEFDFTNGFKATELPKKHIDLDREMILLEPGGDTGIPYTDDDNIMVLGKKKDFGLFLKTAPYAIYKRGGFGDYAQWLELFGMPQRVGKYNSYDTESRRLLEQAMESAGSAPYIVVPKEAEIETTNNTGSGSSGTSFNDFRKACNEELLITVLGQTLTSVQGDKGARSLGEVHKEVEEGKNRSDLRFVQRILNQKLLPLLERRGFPVKGGRFVFPKSAAELTVSDIVQLSDILEIPAYFLQEKYSIPAAEKGETLARRTAPTTIQFEEPTEPKKEPPKTPKEKEKEPEEIENNDKSFLLRLWDFFVSAPALTMTGAATNHLTLNDADLNDRIIGRIDGKGKFDVELFEFISRDLIKALDDKPKRMADVGFTYQHQNDAFRTAQELNIFQFSAAKTLEEIKQLNQIYRDSNSFEEFYKKSTELTGKFNKTWQQTEYASATNISSASETYHRLKAKENLFKYWQYKTVGDDKVREEHEKLDGVILRANDKRWDKIYPPNGWRCRCYIVPRLKNEVPNFEQLEEGFRQRVDAYLDSDEWDKVEKTGFGINRALEPELFEANQMYIRKFPTRAAKLMQDINYQTYKLGTVKQRRDNATAKLEATDTLESFEASMIIEDNKSFIKDYNERLVRFNFDKWKKGHKGQKYDERPKLLKGLAEAMATPDEVWINGHKSKYFNQYTYLKYYKDVAVVVNASIEQGKVFQIKTWFVLDEFKGAIMDRRYGMLIYNKIGQR